MMAHIWKYFKIVAFVGLIVTGVVRETQFAEEIAKLHNRITDQHSRISSTISYCDDIDDASKQRSSVLAGIIFEVMKKTGMVKK